MRRRTRRAFLADAGRLATAAAVVGWPPAADAMDAMPVTFREEPGRVEIRVTDRPFATYVYRDDAIPRPYFAHARAIIDTPVTRTHPPVAGTDATDHADMHPGLWMAFGDLGGADNWRNKAKVVHDGFVDKPRGGDANGSFAVRNRNFAADGTTVLAHETFRCRIKVVPIIGPLIVWDSEFRPTDRELTFGDQEEMGLGVRLATPLTVKAGGRITGSGGEVNEKQVRGKQLDWSDYSGVVEADLGHFRRHRVGVMLVPDPKNFRRSWFHARDYGLLVANPFARKSLGQGEASRVGVRLGETLRLRFGVLVHASAVAAPFDLTAASATVLKHLETTR